MNSLPSLSFWKFQVGFLPKGAGLSSQLLERAIALGAMLGACSFACHMLREKNRLREAVAASLLVTALLIHSQQGGAKWL